MSNGLPPDLERLGDQLAGAAARTAATARLRREARRRLAMTAALGALVFGALTPAALGPAHRGPFARLAALSAQDAPSRCDQPRGARFALPECEAAMVLDRPYAFR